MVELSNSFTFQINSHIGVRNPGPKAGLGYSDFARRY